MAFLFAGLAFCLQQFLLKIPGSTESSLLIQEAFMLPGLYADAKVLSFGAEISISLFQMKKLNPTKTQAPTTKSKLQRTVFFFFFIPPIDGVSVFMK